MWTSDFKRNNVKLFFDLLKIVLVTFKLLLFRICNIDEIDVITVQQLGGQVQFHINWKNRIW